MHCQNQRMRIHIEDNLIISIIKITYTTIMWVILYIQIISSYADHFNIQHTYHLTSNYILILVIFFIKKDIICISLDNFN